MKQSEILELLNGKKLNDNKTKNRYTSKIKYIIKE